jgi:glycosyltransferase involved in cell wall biosynthesis
MRILVFTSLYPNDQMPHHGVFVENRLRHLLAESGWEAGVVAPVPWFPSRHPAFGTYARMAAVPGSARRHGIPVRYPRYPLLPKVSMSLAPLSMYLGARRTARALVRAIGGVDLIDAHYLYPDGVAAALLARELAVPLSITGRGTDLNLIPRYRVPRAQINWAAQRADALVTVCDALRDDLAAAGIDKDRAEVLRNGVDLTQFRRELEARRELRRAHGLQGPVLLSVGHLIPRKRHDLAIRSLAALPMRATLLIAGTGPEEARLKRLARQLGLSGRVRFLGAVPHADLYRWYSASDLLILASAREGWPNVLLESLACGTPTVATAVNGTPEVLQDPTVGRVVHAAGPDALAASALALLAEPPTPERVRAYAEGFSWRATSRGQMALMRRIARDDRAHGERIDVALSEAGR